MTHPSEQAIKAACEEAGVPYRKFVTLGPWAPSISLAILALARRIGAEEDAEARVKELEAEIRTLRAKLADAVDRAQLITWLENQNAPEDWKTCWDIAQALKRYEDKGWRDD